MDAACAMLGAVTTMWDVLSWGGETQALIYNPKLKKVIGINALGVAPTGATADFYHSKGYRYPPEYGPLAAVTPGTPGGLMTMLAEYGTLSLADVLAPAIQMADGYPIEAADRQLHRAATRTRSRSGSTRAPSSCLMRGAHSRGAGARRDVRSKRSGGHAAQAGRCGAAGAQGGKEPQGRDLRGVRPLLQGRHRPGAGARRAGRGRTVHDRRPGELEGQDRGAAQHDVQGDHRLQAPDLAAGAGDAPGAQHPGERRPQGDGLQLAEVHPHALPDDEPRLCRPRLLLRRSLLPARRAGARDCCRRSTRRRATRRSTGRATIRPSSPGDPYPYPGWHESVRDAARSSGRRFPTRTPPRRVAGPTRPRCRVVRALQSFYAGTTSIEIGRRGRGGSCR